MSALDVMKFTDTCGKSIVSALLKDRRGFEEAVFFSATSSHSFLYELYILGALLEYPLRDHSI